MRVYVVQHGEAKSKEEAPERPLTERGRQDVSKIATFLAEHTDMRPANIHHSGKARAQETAEILAEAASPRQGISQVEGLNPLDDPTMWVDRLSTTDQDTMLVGHLPHLGKLVSRLLCGEEERSVVAFKMGGVVCLTRDETGRWSLAWMLVPEMV
jgi:phosphohistidine phosphatase